MNFLSEEAHNRGLALGLKNAADLASDLVDVTDFAIVEECHTYAECGRYKSFTSENKAVFSVEYDRGCPDPYASYSVISCDLDISSTCDLCSSATRLSGDDSTSNTDTQQPLFSSEHSRSTPSELETQLSSSLS